MEKLIELLNEYEKIKENSEYVQFRWSKNKWGDIARYDEYDQREGDNLQTDTATTYLISKDFGFIKWLVDNDKIDREKVIKEIGGCIKISGLGPHYTFYSALLMILAVSDNPIEDLISYLR